MQLERLILGDTLNFTTSVVGYAANDGWTLKYRFVPRAAGPSPITLTATADATDPTLHRVQVTATTTAGWTAATYAWHSWVEKAAEKYSVASGSIQLIADPRSASTADLRTTAEKALEDVKAAYAAFVASNGTQRRYRIGERELEFSSASEIVKLANFWQIEVNRERNAAAIAAGQPSRRQIHVRVARA